MKRDMRMYSAASDGIINEYDLTNGWKKEQQFDSKRKQSYCALVPSTHDVVYATGKIGEESVIIEVRETWKDRSLEGIELTALCCVNSSFNLSCLIGGTADGRLLVFPSIFNPRSYNTYFVHNSAVTIIKQSADGRFLFTSGEDGSIFIFNVSEYFSSA